MCTKAHRGPEEDGSSATHTEADEHGGADPDVHIDGGDGDASNEDQSYPIQGCHADDADEEGEVGAELDVEEKDNNAGDIKHNTEGEFVRESLVVEAKEIGSRDESIPGKEDANAQGTEEKPAEEKAVLRDVYGLHLNGNITIIRYYLYRHLVVHQQRLSHITCARHFSLLLFTLLYWRKTIISGDRPTFTG